MIGAAVVGAIPALLLRTLLDTAIPDKNVTLVTVIAVGVVLLALANSAFSMLASGGTRPASARG